MEEEGDGESKDSFNFIDGVAARVWAKLVSVPWGDFARSPELWAVTFAHMVSGGEIGGKEKGGAGGNLDVLYILYIFAYTDPHITPTIRQKQPSKKKKQAHNYGLYVLLAWLPTYFSQTYGLDLKASSTLSVAPWVAAAVVSNLAG